MSTALSVCPISSRRGANVSSTRGLSGSISRALSPNLQARSTWKLSTHSSTYKLIIKEGTKELDGHAAHARVCIFPIPPPLQ